MKKLSNLDFQHKLDSKAPLDYELVGDYEGGNNPVTLLHKACNKEVTFNVAKNVFRVKSCKHCNPEFHRNSEEDINKALSEYGITLLEKYKSDSEKHLFKFPCGCSHCKIMSNVKRGVGVKCNICDNRISNYNIPLEESNARLKSAPYGNFTIVGNYKGYSGKTDIKCNDCGYINYDVKPSSVIRQVRGCGFCNNQFVNSVKERFIKQILSDIGERFIAEYHFEGMTYNSAPLRVDFYLPDKDVVIEYDGVNHDFDENLKERDTFKDTFLENRSIKILRLHHTESGIISKILSLL